MISARMFSSLVPDFSIYGLELNRETLLGHLFVDFHYIFKKREKGNILTL